MFTTLHCSPPSQVRALASLEFSPHVVRYYSCWIEPDWERLSKVLQKNQPSNLPKEQHRKQQGQVVMPISQQTRVFARPSVRVHRESDGGASSSGQAISNGSSSGGSYEDDRSDRKESEASILSEDEATRSLAASVTRNSAFTFGSIADQGTKAPCRHDSKDLSPRRPSAAGVRIVEVAGSDESIQDGSNSDSDHLEEESVRSTPGVDSSSISRSESSSAIAGHRQAIVLAAYMEPPHRNKPKATDPADGVASKAIDSTVRPSAEKKWPYVLFISMEPVSGITLDMWLKRRLHRMLPAPADRSGHESLASESRGWLGSMEHEIFRQIVLGLMHCHAAGVIHRGRHLGRWGSRRAMNGFCFCIPDSSPALHILQI